MRVRLALIPLVATAALLAGCATTGTTAGAAPTSSGPVSNGVEAMAPADIITKAKAALASAKSYHVKGGTTDAGEKATIDATFQGKNWGGNIQADGLSFDIVVVGTDIYLKAPDAVWAMLIPAGPQSTLAALTGKWVKADTSTPGLSSFADISPDDFLQTNGTLSKGDAKTINGTPAVGVVSADKTVIYVATQGEPYPLQVVDPSGTQNLTIDQFNSAPAVTVPAAADVFDFKALMGG
jgi:hypothetical protein